jgi:hypothetical protein
MSAATTSAIQTAPANRTGALNESVDDETIRRLNILLAENDEFSRRHALYRDEYEESRMLTMRRPITAKKAYGTLGLFLGAFAPAAYFTKVGYGLHPYDGNAAFLILLFMNIICALAGYGMGRALGDLGAKAERLSWSQMIPAAMGVGLLWAIATGFLGGVIIFVVGGFAGAALAAPVALIAFPVFASLHRLVERGKMIELKHLLPIAAGIAMTIAAFILGYPPAARF